MIRRFLFFFLLLPFLPGLHAQTTGGTEQLVEILPGTLRLYLQMPDANTTIQTLAGNVRLRQGRTLFSCDSCIINSATKIFEAFGNVHIIDDTTQVWSNYLRYNSNTRLANLTGRVRLSDVKINLTTNDLDYDVANKIGNYRGGGRVVNRKTVLTSQEGTYYTDVKDFYFRRNVVLIDPAYTLRSDSLLYNTQLQTARFIARTYIRDSSGRTIETDQGFYDVANSRSEFTSRTTIRDNGLTVTGDQIASDDASGIVQIEGRGVLIDSAQGTSILADRIFANKKLGSYLATRKPLMIIRQDEDSIYVTADTLFSAKLTERYKGNDSLLKTLGVTEKDSTNRYFEAFRNVRIFSDSLQAVSDSLYYSFKDSIFQLYQDPVVWSQKSQITGDTIFLYTKNKKADRMRVYLQSFMVSEVQPGVYNQVQSSRMDAYFKAGVIDSVRARGSAESIYFLQDEDSAFTNVNQTTSDLIDLYFYSGELDRVVLRSSVKGTLHPIAQKPPGSARLSRFRWLDARRPKTKYELFE
jgi:lipopolysaccharide export system protein LptA